MISLQGMAELLLFIVFCFFLTIFIRHLELALLSFDDEGSASWFRGSDPASLLVIS